MNIKKRMQDRVRCLEQGCILVANPDDKAATALLAWLRQDGPRPQATRQFNRPVAWTIIGLAYAVSMIMAVHQAARVTDESMGYVIFVCIIATIIAGLTGQWALNHLDDMQAEGHLRQLVASGQIVAVPQTLMNVWVDCCMKYKYLREEGAQEWKTLVTEFYPVLIQIMPFAPFLQDSDVPIEKRTALYNRVEELFTPVVSELRARHDAAKKRVLQDKQRHAAELSEQIDHLLADTPTITGFETTRPIQPN